MNRRPKQRMISAEDLVSLVPVPDAAKPTAMWLWLHLDPLGRGLMDPTGIARRMQPPSTPDTILEHLVMLMDAGWLTTFHAEGEEWILLLYPLKTDLRNTPIHTPEPPPKLSMESVAMGRGVRERARERARAEVRAEDAARADAWAAVQRDREEQPERPERPAVLDAPQMFCDDHMPGGAGRQKCGPCRDARLLRDEWMQRRVYEERMTTYHEQVSDEGVWDDEIF